MFRTLKLSLLIVAVATLAACSSTPEDESGAPVDDRTVSQGAGGASTSGADGSGVNGSDMGAGKDDSAQLKDPASILSRRNIFFAYDSFVVEDQYRALVEAHARYLVGHPAARMMVQGHTDERGTHEYNIALAQKRADAVKRAMVLLGAKESQIETVSFGKESPRNTGHDETAWAENRRADIVYAGE